MHKVTAIEISSKESIEKMYMVKEHTTLCL